MSSSIEYLGAGGCLDSNLDRKRTKLGFTQRQVQAGFGAVVSYEAMRWLGYKPVRRTRWETSFKAKDRFEAFQRLEYERVMGRQPVLGVDTTTIEECHV